MAKLSDLLNIPGGNTAISPRSVSTGYDNLLGGYSAKIIDATPNPITVTEEDVGKTIVNNGSTVSLTASNISSYVGKTYGLAGTFVYLTLAAIQDMTYYFGNSDDYDDWAVKTTTITEDMIGRFIVVSASTTSASAVELTADNIATYVGTSQKLIRYHVGQTIYVYTNGADDNTIHKAKITSITFYFSSSILQSIRIGVLGLNDEILSVSGTSQNFTPQRVRYTFKGSSLSEYTKANGQTSDIAVTNQARYFRLLKLTASSLNSVGGWKPTITKDGESFTKFSYKWTYKKSSSEPCGDDTLLITFSASQIDALNSVFNLTGPSGLDTEPSIAIIPCEDFSYTVDVSGEFNTAAGCNNRTLGNGNTNVGDFTVVSGLHNSNIAAESDIGGVFNKVHEGSQTFIRGVNNFSTGRYNYIFGSSNKVYFDGNLIVGGLNESYDGDNILMGHSNKSFSKMNVGIGSQIKFEGTSGASYAFGKNLTVDAKSAILIGYDGELPEFEGTLGQDNQPYSTGDVAGVHNKGAIAFAAGQGRSAGTDKLFIPFKITKYRWRKNPAYPWGSTAQDYTDRSKTIADRMILEYSPLVTIDADVRINGSISHGDVQNVELSSPQVFAWTKDGSSWIYTSSEKPAIGDLVYTDSSLTTTLKKSVKETVDGTTVTNTYDVPVSEVTRWETSTGDVLFTANSTPAVGEYAYLLSTLTGTKYSITAVTATTIKANSKTYTLNHTGIILVADSTTSSVYTRDSGADVYDNVTVTYTASENSFVVNLDGKLADRFKVICGTGTVAFEIANVNEFDTIKLAIKNGGTLVTFPAEWVVLGSIPALQTSGIDLFEITYLEGIYYYKHVLGTAN